MGSREPSRGCDPRQSGNNTCGQASVAMRVAVVVVGLTEGSRPGRSPIGRRSVAISFTSHRKGVRDKAVGFSSRDHDRHRRCGGLLDHSGYRLRAVRLLLSLRSLAVGAAFRAGFRRLFLLRSLSPFSPLPPPFPSFRVKREALWPASCGSNAPTAWLLRTVARVFIDPAFPMIQSGIRTTTLRRAAAQTEMCR